MTFLSGDKSAVCLIAVLCPPYLQCFHFSLEAFKMKQEKTSVFGSGIHCVYTWVSVFCFENFFSLGCAELPELADLCLSQNLGKFSTSLLQIFCTVLIFLLFLWDFNDMNSRCFYSVPWVSKALFVTLLPSCFSD